MAEQHRRRQNRTERIRDSLPGDVWGRAMNRFVQAYLPANARGGEQAERPNDSAGLVGEDVSEHIFGEDYVEISGALHQQHGGRVDILMGERDFWIVLGNACHDFAPQAGAFQDVCLIYRENLFLALSGEIESYAGDALDFVFGVTHGVDGDARARLSFDGSRLAEVGSAQKFADDQDVGAADEFGAQWRRILKRGKKDSGTEIGVGSQFAADAEQSGFGAELALEGLVEYTQTTFINAAK